MNRAGGALLSGEAESYKLRAISGTLDFVIVRRCSGLAATLVAEIVSTPDGFTICRMDATGVLGEGFVTPATALDFFEDWVSYAHP